jgi:hypothetical protein
MTHLPEIGQPRKGPWLTSVLCGVIAGGALGSGNGLLTHWLLAEYVSASDGALWGAILGTGGGIGYALLARAIWGAAGNNSIGLVLGVWYGLIPGVAKLFEVLFVGRVLFIGGVGLWFMAGGMVGLFAGGILDRLFEALRLTAGSRAVDRPEQERGVGVRLRCCPRCTTVVHPWPEGPEGLLQPTCPRCGERLR